MKKIIACLLIVRALPYSQYLLTGNKFIYHIKLILFPLTKQVKPMNKPSD